LRQDHRRLIIISSLQLDIKPEILRQHGGGVHFVPSWTLKEFQNAIENKEFYTSVADVLGNGETPEEKLFHKYCYAGGSARWMFSLSIADVCADVEHYINCVSDKAVLSSGLTGTQSDVAINHLFMADHHKKPFLISEFVTRMLAETCESTFLKQAMMSDLINNPSFDGWILEADFLFQVRIAKQSQLKLLDFQSRSPNNQTPTISWEVAQRLHFRDVVDLDGETLTENTWFIPLRWNQGCYDAVQLLPDNGVRIIQVTRADTHSLKLRYVVEMLNQIKACNFGIDSIEIAFVLPSDKDPETFQLKHPIGTLGDYKGCIRKHETNECFFYGLFRTQ